MQTTVQITRNGLPALPNSPTNFGKKLDGAQVFSARIDTLQVNVGKLCNQACKHFF